MTLGETIKLLRTELGLTQPELAEKAGIEQSYLSKLENDKGTPSFDIINRIAQALNLSGMGLIQKLSHSYIDENLSHLPEVAAEYASIKQKLELRLTRRMLTAALLLIVGVGLYLVSQAELLDSNRQFVYSSEGVLRPGEHVDQFSESHLGVIGETGEEYEARLVANRGRFDRDYRISDNNNGREFIVELPDGNRRYYVLISDDYVASDINQLAGVIGKLCALAGLLIAAWTLWRARRS